MDMQNEDHLALKNKFTAYISTFERFNSTAEDMERSPSPPAVHRLWLRWRLDKAGAAKVVDLEYPVAVALWNDMLMAWPLGMVEINDPDLKPMPVEYRHELPEVTPEWAVAFHNRLMNMGVMDSALSDAAFMQLMTTTRHGEHPEQETRDIVGEGWARFCKEFSVDMEDIFPDRIEDARKAFYRKAPDGEVRAREKARKMLNL